MREVVGQRRRLGRRCAGGQRLRADGNRFGAAGFGLGSGQPGWPAPVHTGGAVAAFVIDDRDLVSGSGACGLRCRASLAQVFEPGAAYPITPREPKRKSVGGDRGQIAQAGPDRDKVRIVVATSNAVRIAGRPPARWTIRRLNSTPACSGQTVYRVDITTKWRRTTMVSALPPVMIDAASRGFRIRGRNSIDHRCLRPPELRQ